MKFSSLKSVHIVGVCGTLMGAFAAFLKRQGIQVSGSDQNIYPPMSDILVNAGVELFHEYSAENIKKISPRPDLIVIGNVIRSDNPEARFAIKNQYEYTSLPEAMEKFLLPLTKNLVVSGTHGKTTTSSLLAYVLEKCGKQPNYFIGGVPEDLPYSFHIQNQNQGQLFVIEGDEYDTAFWDKVPKFNHYLPDHVILTSVEYDHADIYPNFESVKLAFAGLLKRMRSNGRLIACVDYPAVQELLSRSNSPVLTYGMTSCQYRPERIRVEGGKTCFAVMKSNQHVVDLSLQIPGNHNVLNALSVWIEAELLGLDPQNVAEAISGFRGVKRRQEIKAEVNNVLVVDDFAHHPTAVRETLSALKLRYPNRRLIAVYEPRSATSRRKIFQNEYTAAFHSADCVFVATPHDQSKIAQNERFSTEELVASLLKKGIQSYAMHAVDEGVSQVARQCRYGDVVAVLSNGGFGGFIPKVIKALSSLI